MKLRIRRYIGALLFTAALTTAHSQSIEATSTTTTSEGTVSEFGPQGIVIKTAAGTQPVRYISSETTNYVDESGNPVAFATVTSGLPVTVFYTKVGDTLIASKIMVRTGQGTEPSIPGLTASAGTISEFGPEHVIISAASSAAALRYTHGKTTSYVDEAGRPVAISALKSGLPVTVYYTKVGTALVASKVIVRKAAATVTPVIETTKTTTTTITTGK